MVTINQLALLSSISPGDQLALYSPNNGDSRRAPISALLSFFQSNFASPDLATTLYTPGAGGNVAIGTPTSNLWVLLQPAGTLATLTVTLPLNTSTPDGTEVLITSTQQITALTIGANGATQVYGPPSALNANEFFRLRFHLATNSWYRIS